MITNSVIIALHPPNCDGRLKIDSENILLMYPNACVILSDLKNIQIYVVSVKVEIIKQKSFIDGTIFIFCYNG